MNKVFTKVILINGRGERRTQVLERPDAIQAVKDAEQAIRAETGDLSWRGRMGSSVSRRGQ